jgi:addiction module HigA family antidote
MKETRLKLKSPTTLEPAMKNTIPLGPAAVTPGEVLREEFIIPMGLSIRELSRRMGCGPMRLSEIVNGKPAITAETALRLAAALGTSARFRMNLQTSHDLAKAARELKLAA